MAKQPKATILRRGYTSGVLKVVLLLNLRKRRNFHGTRAVTLTLVRISPAVSFKAFRLDVDKRGSVPCQPSWEVLSPPQTQLPNFCKFPIFQQCQGWGIVRCKTSLALGFHSFFLSPHSGV